MHSIESTAMSFFLSVKSAIALANLGLAIFLFGCLCVDIYRINIIPDSFQAGLTKAHGYFDTDRLDEKKDNDEIYSNWTKWSRMQDSVKTTGWAFLLVLLNVIILSNLVVGSTLAPGLVLPANLWRYAIIAMDCFALWALGLMMLMSMFNLPILMPIGAFLLFIADIVILFMARTPI